MTNSKTKSEKIVTQVVDSFVSKNKAFTSFNVAHEAKNSGFNGKHSEIKEIIKPIMKKKTNYTSQLVSVSNDPGRESFVYFPVMKLTKTVKKSTVQVAKKPMKRAVKKSAAICCGGNPTSTWTINLKPSKKKTTKKVTKRSKSMNATSATSTSDVYSTQSDGRLGIRKSLLNQIGAMPLNPVYIFGGSNNAVLIRSKKPTSNRDYSTQWVQYDGTTRLSEQTRQKFGLKGGSKFRVDVNNESIVVRKG